MSQLCTEHWHGLWLFLDSQQGVAVAMMTCSCTASIWHGLPCLVPYRHATDMCFAGDQFALFESVVALAMLMRRFNFSMAPAAPAVGMTTVSPQRTSTSIA